MLKSLKEKFIESLFSVLPITIIIIILNACFGFTDKWSFISFLNGAILLIFGITFFTLGSDMSMTPIGISLGSYLTRKRKLWLLLGVSGLLGILITISEPDLLTLSEQFTAVPAVVLIICVALGVGIFLMLAMLRIVLKIKLSYILLGGYFLIFLLALILQIIGKEGYIPISFDSGGVTTGPMTVPFILAIGYGVAKVRGGSDSQDDSFGLVALCSIGPIIAVMILGLFAKGNVDTSSTTIIYQSFNEYIYAFFKTLLKMVGEVSLALVSILIFIIIYLFFIVKESKKNITKVGIGLIYTFIGLVLFLTGANMGFMPMGQYFGKTLGSASYNWVLIPIGMIMGFFVVMAEPAVHVLNKQVEDVSSGTITKKTMLYTLAIGVAISIGLAMLRIICDFSIWCIVLPGYLIALSLTFFVPKMFTAIAFDSGGVASGPMTAAFLLPFATGVCIAINGDDINKLLTNGFGIVALVAMTPLIVIQVLGLIYKFKLEKKIRQVEQAVYEDIIDFTLDEKVIKECSYE